MSTIPFDTHAFVKKLEAVGFTEPQAEVQAQALAELVNDQLATKRDLQELEMRLESGMRELELRLKHDLTLRLGAMMAAGIAIVAVLVRFL